MNRPSGLAKKTLQLVMFVVLKTSFGQSFIGTTVQLYPENFHSDFLVPSLSIRRLDENQKYSALAVYQRYTGLVNGIYTTRFKGFMRIKKRHQLGILANTMKEGPYIGTVQVLAHYANFINLSSKAVLSAGAGFGVAGLYYDGGGIGEEGRAFVPDISLDIALKLPTFYASIIVQQVNSPVLTPLANTIEMGRYFEGRCGKDFKLGPFWKMGLQGHGIYYPKNSPNQPNLWGGMLGFEYQKTFKINAASYNLNTIIIQSAFKLPIESQFAIRVLGSYKTVLSGIQNLSAIGNSWELGLEFYGISTK